MHFPYLNGQYHLYKCEINQAFALSSLFQWLMDSSNLLLHDSFYRK